MAVATAKAPNVGTEAAPSPLRGVLVLELSLPPADVVQVFQVLGREYYQLLRAPDLAQKVLVVVVVENCRRSALQMGKGKHAPVKTGVLEV